MTDEQQSTPTQDAAPDAGTELDRLQGPDAVDTTPVQVDVRRGQFGAADGPDTSGYGGLRTPVLLPGASARPYGGYFDEVADALQAALPGEGTAYQQAIERVVVDRGEMTIFVSREHLAEVAGAMRDDPALRFEMCMSVSGVHFPHEAGRELHAVYHLISMTHDSRRVRLEVTAPDDDPHIPSVVAVWPGADWHERETWDMFGIVFDGHPALTRILMPDDWPGHPQRKDYPLGGIPVEYKGGTIPPPDERRSYS
ncbi:MAG TPA: NADH-quinone oxidoreductase subunit C [Pengzhenrongella sp.]